MGLLFPLTTSSRKAAFLSLSRWPFGLDDSSLWGASLYILARLFHSNSELYPLMPTGSNQNLPRHRQMSPGLGEVGTKSLPVQNHCTATPWHSDYIQLIGSPLCGAGGRRWVGGGGCGGGTISPHPWPSLSPGADSAGNSGELG